jgi:hypothetical protein
MDALLGRRDEMTTALALSLLVMVPALAAAGWWLGPARSARVLLAMAAGSVSAGVLGPWFETGVTRGIGWNTWMGVALAWAAAYAGVAIPASVLLNRRQRPPSGRRARAAAAAGAAALGAVAAWLLFAPPPSEPDFEPVGWVRAPFACARALRILRDVSPEEAQWLAVRPDVKAVAESESIRRLMRDEAILARVRLASDGDHLALLALAADADVKAAMDDPAFLARVRQVDLQALAESVVARRAGRPVASGSPAGAGREETGAWRVGYALGAGLRDGLRSLSGGESLTGGEARGETGHD